MNKFLTNRAQAVTVVLILLIMVGIVCLAAHGLAMRHAQIIKHQVKYIKAKYWADAGVQVARDWLERGGHGTIGIGTSAFVDYTTLPSPPANGADWTNLPVPITGATENEIGMTITIEVFNVGTGQTDDTADYRIGSTVYYER